MGQFDSIRFQPSRPLLKEVSADRLNAILSEIKKNRPRGERGITVRHSGEGTYIGLASSGGKGSAAPVTNHPFQIAISSPAEDQYEATIRPGTINGILPSGILSGAELQTYPLSSSLQYVVLTATSSNGQITSAQIGVESQAPSSQAGQAWGLPSQAKFLIGVTFENSAFQVVYDNISVAGKLLYIQSRVAAIGELPYTPYYIWA